MVGNILTGYNGKDFLYEVETGKIPGHSIIHKFGKNTGITTTPTPISSSGIYRTPTVATTLRIKAGGSPNDAAAGTGAQQLTLIGLDENFDEVTETIETAGASASAVTTTTFIRLYRVYVSRTGTYATSTAGSHAASITIENGTGGTDWALIDFTGFPRGQSQIGAYSVPAGYTAFVYDVTAWVDSGKTANILFFQRDNIDDVVAPYSGVMRLQEEIVGASGEFTFDRQVPSQYSEKTDIGFMAYVALTTASVSVSFNILLVQNKYLT